MAYDLLKVSRVYVKNNPQLLFCNFNVPVHRIQDVETIKTVLKTIEEDYGKDLSKLFFAISASYILQHKETNEERQFCGSFHSKGIYKSLVLRFLPLRTDTFVNTVLQHTILSNILSRLSLMLPNSVWKFKELTSIVINIQGPSTVAKKSFENVLD